MTDRERALRAVLMRNQMEGTKYMSATDRFNIVRSAPKALEAFGAVEGLLASSGVDPLLRHLVKLRVSQINGCAYCVNMHTKEARDDGESNERLDHVIVWRNSGLFSDAEKAALAWSEAMTVPGQGADLDRLYGELTRHFSSEDIDALMLIVVMINSWNRLQVANHNASF
ncbi:MAG: carboxymuconolactone decarboxylase family protein [Parvibaculaceae bacterium]